MYGIHDQALAWIRSYLSDRLTYICDMVTKYRPRRQLRSSDRCMLVVPKIKTKGYGAQIFFVCFSNFME